MDLGIGEVAESQLVGQGRLTLRRPNREEDPAEIGLATYICRGAHSFQDKNFANRGPIFCEYWRALPSDAWMDRSFSVYYEMGPHFPTNPRF